MTRRLLAVSIVVAALLAAWPADALAQRGGRGGGGRAPQRMPTVLYPPWYGPFGGGFGYPYQYPYPYRGYGYDNSAELRIQATPRETEVFVDGARAGIVDDYDGIFQRLHLTPGEHEITLYLAGFRTWREYRYFGPHSDQRILHTMLQLAPGQPDEPRPLSPPPQDRRVMNRDPNNPNDNRPMPPDRRQPLQPRNPQPPAPPSTPPPPPEPRNPQAPERPANEPRSFGTLSVGIQPVDADVLVDGKKQSLAAGQGRLIIQLPEGVHRLVIQKDGLQTWETDLQIRRGRTLAFNVSLVK